MVSVCLTSWHMFEIGSLWHLFDDFFNGILGWLHVWIPCFSSTWLNYYLFVWVYVEALIAPYEHAMMYRNQTEIQSTLAVKCQFLQLWMILHIFFDQMTSVKLSSMIQQSLEALQSLIHCGPMTPYCDITLAAPNHYLKQCWLTKSPGNQSTIMFTWMLSTSIHAIPRLCVWNLHIMQGTMS